MLVNNGGRLGRKIGAFFFGAVGRLTQNREFREFSEFRGYTADIHSRTILLSKGVVPDYTTLILCTILASECAVVLYRAKKYRRIVPDSTAADSFLGM